MTKDVVVGTVTGVVAVLAVAVLSPRAQQPPVVVGEIVSGPSAFYDGLGRSYLPMTRPDPTRARLERQRIERLEARGLALEKVIERLREATGMNLFVSWRALEAAGVDRHAPVTVELKDVTAAVALRMVLRDAGGGNVVLAYHAADEVVTISTADDLSREVYTRIYTIRDLVEEEFAYQRRVAGDPSKAMTEMEVADELIKLIQEIIDPPSWRDAGGSVGGIRYFGGRLIVTHTLDGHEQIMELLAALRLTAAPKAGR